MKNVLQKYERIKREEYRIEITPPPSLEAKADETADTNEIC